jgi:hypothetical protein
VASLADQVGWHVSTLIVPNSGHIGMTLSEGLKFAYHKLFTASRFPTEGATPARYLCAPQSSPTDCGDHQSGRLIATIALIDLGLVSSFILIKGVLFFRSPPMSITQ